MDCDVIGGGGNVEGFPQLRSHFNNGLCRISFVLVSHSFFSVRGRCLRIRNPIKGPICGPITKTRPLNRWINSALRIFMANSVIFLLKSKIRPWVVSIPTQFRDVHSDCNGLWLDWWDLAVCHRPPWENWLDSPRGKVHYFALVVSC